MRGEGGRENCYTMFGCMSCSCLVFISEWFPASCVLTGMIGLMATLLLRTCTYVLCTNIPGTSHVHVHNIYSYA